MIKGSTKYFFSKSPEIKIRHHFVGAKSAATPIFFKTIFSLIHHVKNADFFVFLPYNRGPMFCLKGVVHCAKASQCKGISQGFPS